jgi:FdhD protein
MDTSSHSFPVLKVNDAGAVSAEDRLAVEEPLEIRLAYLGQNGLPVIQPISVTMRTPGPGEDIELAAGFLLTEGIIQQRKDIQELMQVDAHVVLVQLASSVKVDLGRLERHFYTSSSCGVCGKTSIDAVRNTCPTWQEDSFTPICQSLIYTLPHRIKKLQGTFNTTGGLHASALFDNRGNLLLLKEDVGRHNALDKLIGSALFDNKLPLHQYILLLSGRASFELIQKATMAGINFVCAVGAPSSLAVELAKERGMTLLGFLRNERFNIYTGEQRVNLEQAAAHFF